ncbi:FAD-dependent oxidoreductase [Blastococcus brunescens]|uniref:FAD-dependent oxidoreductase n=1 Tax=Blastococcus brunescens TaxID=1564165 RepID=A0ABZ1B990_9ACTN|nr:FAD-dependent oxidoreductase [Blastococcus sp. BMG 8361]WRL67304.1 FAD-dependent oxidoreductase [Blastococcus sp. BMG 8361]
MVREALAERSRLVQTIAPHLVTPLPFLLPLTSPVWQRAYFGAGVALYDVLGAAFTPGRESGGRGIPRHRHLSRAKTLEAFPALRGTWCAVPSSTGTRRWTTRGTPRRGAHGSGVRRARAVQRPGDRAAAGRRRRGAPGSHSPVVGARVADLTDGSSFTVRARSVVAATGVWSDDIGSMLGDAAPSLKVRASKGVHLVLPGSAIDRAELAGTGVTRPA